MTPGLAGSGGLELNLRSSSEASPESAVVPRFSGLNEVVRFADLWAARCHQNFVGRLTLLRLARRLGLFSVLRFAA